LQIDEIWGFAIVMCMEINKHIQTYKREKRKAPLSNLYSASFASSSAILFSSLRTVCNKSGS
jgi:hypothetical protein